MTPKLNRLILVFSCLVPMLSAHANADDSRDASLQLRVGLATWAGSSYYRDVDEEHYAFPLVMAEFGRCYLETTNLGCRVYQGPNRQQISMEIDRTFDGFESSDASFLSGMAERKSSWEAGLAYEVSVGGGQLKGKLMSDISNTHEGYSTRFEYEHAFWQDDAHLVNWFLGGEYWDRAKTDYYFGVKTSEARPGRAAYTASDSYSLIAGGNAFKRLSSKVTLLFSAEYRSASNEIEDSPLVSRADQWSTYGGFFYQF